MKIPKLSTVLIICIAVVAAVLVLPRLFSNLGGNSLVWLFVLACPLMHIFMMKGHGQGHNENSDKHENTPARGGCCSKPVDVEKKEKESLPGDKK